MQDYKLYLSSFKTRRGKIIAETFTKTEFRTIHIKDGRIIQTIEIIENKDKTFIHCPLDSLIYRFKRSDQRRNASKFNNWKFTDFGLGFMYGIYFQNLWYARKSQSKEEDSRDKEREIYYRELCDESEDFPL